MATSSSSSSPPSSTKVAVVGAGVIGLMAMKNFKEDGFDVTCFETRSYVGGLWKDSDDSALSVHPTTVFNSSKYRSAISDFPFADEVDDFPTAPQMHQYLQSYSDHFDLTPRIRFNTKVLDLQRRGSKWALTVQTANEPARTELFDKVASATGTFYTPKRLPLVGADNFAGKIIHAIDYHHADEMTGKNVLLIGMHASAQDIAYTLKPCANKLYMSHRNGILLLPRYADNGTPYDTMGGLRLLLIQTFMSTWFPRLWTWMLDRLLGSMSRKTFNIRPEWNLLPAPSFAVATPLIADKLYPLLDSGFAQPVAEVKSITGPRSVSLADGTQLDDVDAIIQCTGYEYAIPFLAPESPYQPYLKPNEPPLLYRNTFSLDPDPAVRNSLVFLGQAGIPLPGFSAFELISQSVSQIWQGKASLPPLSEMKRWHRDLLRWRVQMIRTYGLSSTFYPVFIPFSDHLRWVDKTSGTGIFKHFDWAWFNWRSWKLWWSDPKLYNTCMAGLMSPAVWRLFDCGGRKSWEGARDRVLRDNELMKQAGERNLQAMQRERQIKASGQATANGSLNGRIESRKEI